MPSKLCAICAGGEVRTGWKGLRSQKGGNGAQIDVSWRGVPALGGSRQHLHFDCTLKHLDSNEIDYLILNQLRSLNISEQICKT